MAGPICGRSWLGPSLARVTRPSFQQVPGKGQDSQSQSWQFTETCQPSPVCFWLVLDVNSCLGRALFYWAIDCASWCHHFSLHFKGKTEYLYQCRKAQRNCDKQSWRLFLLLWKFNQWHTCDNEIGMLPSLRLWWSGCVICSKHITDA